MKGSISGNASKGSSYLGKPKSPVYSNTGKNIHPIGGNMSSYAKGNTLCISYRPKGSDDPVKYDPPIVQGYSKINQSGNQKSPYLEMKILDFSNSFDQESLGFNLCDICRAPVPKPLRMCTNCSASLLGSYRV